MKQPIAGVVPCQLQEVTIRTVWPSISAYASGRMLGRLYSLRWPDVYIFRIGHLLALLSIPHALVLYFWRVLPWVGVRYTLTNRRVVVQRGLRAVDDRWINLDRFDAIEVHVQRGQEWFKAGDLVFKRGEVETFRLAGVSRPEAFRNTCLHAQRAHVGVMQVVQRQSADA